MSKIIGGEGGGGFKFYDYLIEAEEVRFISFIEWLPFVLQLQLGFSFVLDLLHLEFQFQGFLINGFEKSRP